MVHIILLYKNGGGFRRVFEPSFQRGVQSFCFVLVFWSKTGFKQKWQELGFPFFCSGACCFMLLLESKRGGGKNIYKTRVFGHSLRERRKREKRRERSEVKKKHHFSIKHFGVLKRAGSCSTFLGPKISVFFFKKKILFL